MKKVVACGLVLVVALAGCAQPMTKTQQGGALGAGLGAALGAGLGQAIGGDTKGTLVGAGIGALVGGLAGGGIGRYMEKQEVAMKQELATSEAASVQREEDLLAVTFKSDVLFDVGSYAPKPGALQEISRVAQVLNQYPQTSITVAGHTDSKGQEVANQRLSEQRAAMIGDALISQGVSRNRIQTVGFGANRPIADNNTEGGRQLNRRVEINITPRA